LRILAVLVALHLTAAGCRHKAEDSTASREQSPPGAGDAATSVVSGTAPPASGGLVSIVLLEPRPVRELPVPAEPTVMDQFGQAFSPTLLLARQGQPVEFRNSEDTLHNVRVYHVESKEPAFNVSLAPFGKYAFTFERSGFYAVSCDIHPAMAADILVTSTPYAVIAENDGRFTFQDIPAGPYTFIILTGGKRIERPVEIAGPKTILNAPDG
jgi:plastocyanin